MNDLTWRKLAPYQTAKGETWWKHPLKPGTVQAAAHGQRSDGSNAFYTVELPESASEDAKTNALTMAMDVVKAHLHCGCHLEEGGTLNPAEPAKHIFCSDHDPGARTATA